MKKIIFTSIALVNLQLFAQQKPLVANEDSALVNVTFTDSKKLPRINEKILFISPITNKIIYEGVTDANGQFQFLFAEGDSAIVQIRTLVLNQNYGSFGVPQKDKLAQTLNIDLQFESVSKSFTLRGLNFESGTATIKKESYPILNELIEALQVKSTLVIEIDGHTDNVGEAVANLKLSQARADAVKKYIVDKGKIVGTRIQIKGFGEDLPISPNDSEEGRAKNRRTDVIIIKE